MDLTFLKPFLGDDLYSQVEAKLQNATGLTLANIADGSYIPKNKFDTERNTVKALTTQVNDLTTQLAAAKAAGGNVDALNAQITQLQADITERDNKIAAIHKDYRIKEDLRGMHFKDVNVIVPLLQQDKITEQDGKLIGLSEQAEAIKKSYPYLADDDQGGNGGFDGSQNIGGSGGSGNSAVNAAIRAAAGRSV
ncbi:MAG: phage scaffolding protein [Clostridia bacterium]|nr:phage scaffolding protein [Clostridia bacterium]